MIRTIIAVLWLTVGLSAAAQTPPPTSTLFGVPIPATLDMNERVEYVLTVKEWGNSEARTEDPPEYIISVQLPSSPYVAPTTVDIPVDSSGLAVITLQVLNIDYANSLATFLVNGSTEVFGVPVDVSGGVATTFWSYQLYPNAPASGSSESEGPPLLLNATIYWVDNTGATTASEVFTNWAVVFNHPDNAEGIGGGIDLLDITNPVSHALDERVHLSFRLPYVLGRHAQDSDVTVRLTIPSESGESFVEKIARPGDSVGFSVSVSDDPAGAMIILNGTSFAAPGIQISNGRAYYSLDVDIVDYDEQTGMTQPIPAVATLGSALFTTFGPEGERRAASSPRDGLPNVANDFYGF